MRTAIFTYMPPSTSYSPFKSRDLDIWSLEWAKGKYKYINWKLTYNGIFNGNSNLFYFCHRLWAELPKTLSTGIFDLHKFVEGHWSTRRRLCRCMPISMLYNLLKHEESIQGVDLSQQFVRGAPVKSTLALLARAENMDFSRFDRLNCREGHKLECYEGNKSTTLSSKWKLLWPSMWALDVAEKSKRGHYIYIYI